MKKYCLLFILVCTLVSCTRLTPGETVPAFSFREAVAAYQESHPDAALPKAIETGGGPVRCGAAALKSAKKACTIEYTDTSVYYDSSMDMWLVVFFIKDIKDACQNVYLDSSGVIRLIVYGG
jgi:hypothetical protein